MELRHLRYFVATAEALSFSRAASKLRLAQPSLSTQIRDLEEELGLQLLERGGNHVSLTDAGSVFLKESKAVLARVDKAVARAHEAAAGLAGELRVASMGPLTVGFLPACLQHFHQVRPAARLKVMEMAPSDQLAEIAAGRLHVGFVPSLFTRLANAKPLDLELILTSPLVVLMSPDHPLAGRKGLRLRELEGNVFLHVILFATDAHRAWTQDVCRRHGFSPRFGSAAGNAENLVSLVATGEGVALIPRIADRIRSAGCRVVPVTDKNLVYELYAVTNARIPSALRGAFLDSVRQEAALAEKEAAAAAGGTGPDASPD